MIKRLRTKHYLCLFCCYLISISALAQCECDDNPNLVPNPSFEEANEPICSDGSTGGQLYADASPVAEWIGVTGQNSNAAGITPDYFSNDCEGNSSQACGAGEASIGIYVIIGSNFTGEYIQVKLTEPLDENREYCLEMDVFSNDNGFFLPSDGLAYYLSPDSIVVPPDEGSSNFLLNFEPYWEQAAGEIIPTSCTQISSQFCAQGGEQWLIIGSFGTADDVELEGGGGGTFDSAYMNIDNVTLKANSSLEVELEASDTIECGECVDLLAVAAFCGDNPTFEWEDLGEGEGPFTVCPLETTTYTFNSSISDDCGTFPQVDEVTINVLPVVNEIAAYEYEVVEDCGSLEVGFTTDYAEGVLLSWDFGNSQFSEEDNPIITYEESGTYEVSLIVTTADVCSEPDTFTQILELAFVDLIVDLGEDIDICEGNPINLDATVEGATYEWQGGSTDASFEVTESGTYWVVVDQEGCLGTDTININIKPFPIIDLGADGFLCDGEAVLLDVSVEGATYEWQDGSTDATYLVEGNGEYSVVVDLDGCIIEDSINFGEEDLPELNITDILLLCESDTTGYLLFPDINIGQGEDVSIFDQWTYLWSDGSTDYNFFVEPGIEQVVSVEITGESCSRVDTIEIYLYECEIFLPITLIDFIGNKVSNANQLNWRTATENNSSHFILERSYDAINFENIAQIESHYFSQEVQSYSYLDQTYEKNNCYYRLRMVDQDGQAEYSNVILLNRNISEQWTVQVLLNTSSWQVTLNSPTDFIGDVNLYDLNGRKLLHQKWPVYKGVNERVLDMSEYANGVYLIEFSNGLTQEVMKIIR